LVDINETVHYGRANLNEAAQHINQSIEQHEELNLHAEEKMEEINAADKKEDQSASQNTNTESDGESRNHHG
jgi:hypothetical protein